jgi:hypothetical protein
MTQPFSGTIAIISSCHQCPLWYELAMVRKRKIILSTLLLLVLIGFIGWINYLFTPTHPISQEQAYALIAREVPLGSSKNEIEEWFGSKNWGDRCGYGVKDGLTVSSWFKGRKKDMTGYISCMINDNSRTIWGSGDLVLVFYLNKDDRLIEYYCHQFISSM